MRENKKIAGGFEDEHNRKQFKNKSNDSSGLFLFFCLLFVSSPVYMSVCFCICCLVASVCLLRRVCKW